MHNKPREVTEDRSELSEMLETAKHPRKKTRLNPRQRKHMLAVRRDIEKMANCAGHARPLLKTRIRVSSKLPVGCEAGDHNSTIGIINN